MAGRSDYVGPVDVAGKNELFAAAGALAAPEHHPGTVRAGPGRGQRRGRAGDRDGSRLLPRGHRGRADRFPGQQPRAGAFRRLARLAEIDRRACRRRVETRFSIATMVAAYEQVYATIFELEEEATMTHIRADLEGPLPFDAEPALRSPDARLQRGPISHEQADQPSKIAFVSDYPPRRCGIATFTHDLRGAVAAQYPDAECGVLAVNDVPEGYDYAPEVQFEIQEQRLRDYQEAVNFLRFNGFDVLCLQHEFGIYGGRVGEPHPGHPARGRPPRGDDLAHHPEEPAPDQRRVMDEIVRQSERLVVMTERGRTILREVYGAPPPRST